MALRNFSLKPLSCLFSKYIQKLECNLNNMNLKIETWLKIILSQGIIRKCFQQNNIDTLLLNWQVNENTYFTESAYFLQSEKNKYDYTKNDYIRPYCHNC